MESKDHAQQLQLDVGEDRHLYRGPVLPVPDRDTLTKAISLLPSATKDWDNPAFLRVPPPGSGRPVSPDFDLDPKDFEIPAHLRRQEPADQRPQPGEPGFECLPLPVPETMRVVPSRPLFDPEDLEIPAHLRGQEPADQRPQPGESGFEPLPLPVSETMRVNRSAPKLKRFNESEIPAFLRQADPGNADKGSW